MNWRKNWMPLCLEFVLFLRPTSSSLDGRCGGGRRWPSRFICLLPRSSGTHRIPSARGCAAVMKRSPGLLGSDGPWMGLCQGRPANHLSAKFCIHRLNDALLIFLTRHQNYWDGPKYWTRLQTRIHSQEQDTVAHRHKNIEIRAMDLLFFFLKNTGEIRFIILRRKSWQGIRYNTTQTDIDLLFPFQQLMLKQ
jgi:hypothetical protein